MSTAAATAAPVWGNGRKATQRGPISRYALLRAVAVGKVRVKLDPGCPPLYNLLDVDALMAERRGGADRGSDPR